MWEKVFQAFPRGIMEEGGKGSTTGGICANIESLGLNVILRNLADR